LPGKTLIFASTDGHADIVVDELKKAFARHYGDIDDAAVAKITGSVDDPGMGPRQSPKTSLVHLLSSCEIT